jgi:quinoprotein glucose dehydrogenase
MRSSLLLATALAAGWPHYGGDPGGTRYSQLDQINRSNVHRLRPAWILDTGDFSDGSRLPGRSAFAATPLVVDGVMYVSTPFQRLLALDPETGSVRWVFDPKFDPATRVNLYTSRGVVYWRNRIFLGDEQGRLFSIDAGSGKPDPSFGEGGFIDLKKGMVEGFERASYGLTSPVVVCGGTVVTGSWVSDGEPRGPSGDIRGWDARTGKLRWRFHTVPRPGEFGHDTWHGDSWKERGGVNAWSMMSCDERRGLVFVPLTSPASDFYGGDRKGANLFGDSVVALDSRTGARKWHFQTVHHNVWDYDLPAQPVLATVDGRDAVAQITKTGFIFLLDRETGRPLFPVEERPVVRSPIPGEESWPTQPFPLKPPPFARQSMTIRDLTDVTPESRKECLEMIREADVETRLYDPLTERLTVLFPGTNGGANWGGGSFDPSTETLYVNSMDVGMFFKLVKRPPGSTIPYRNQGFSRFWDSNRYPCQKPPWGSLSAIDLKRGEIRWRATLGEFPELARRGVAKTGTPNIGGSIVTAGGLVFIAATNDSRFRAFDKTTGEEVWSAELPASGHATPMTYLGPRSGRQYVVIAAGGGNKYNERFAARLVAFALDGQLTETAAPPSRLAYSGIIEKLPGPVVVQPVAFSHKVHSTAARLRCQDCHKTAATSERAGLPGENVCRTCHPAMTGPLDWARVYKVPDFVFFSHAAHRGVTCARCHGPVESRDVLVKEVSTSMVACMNCHRSSKAPLGCDSCHQLGQ